MSDFIPPADSIRQKHNGQPDDVEKWLEQTLKGIGKFISENEAELGGCQIVIYHYPLNWRDMGRNKWLWNQHYIRVCDPLVEKGYVVSFGTGIGGEVIMRIWIRGCRPEQPEEKRLQRPTDTSHR